MIKILRTSIAKSLRSIGNRQWAIDKFKSSCILLLIANCLLPIVFTACKEAKKNQPEQKASTRETYTCPMHPQIIKDKPGSCPVCGMDLVKKTTAGEKVGDVTLNDLLRPSNQYVLSSILTVHIQERDEPVEITTYLFMTYDTRH